MARRIAFTLFLFVSGLTPLVGAQVGTTPSQAFPSQSDGTGQAQSAGGYPTQGAARGQQTYPGYQQTYPSQGGYSQGGYSQGGGSAYGYIYSPPVLPYREGIEPPQGYVLESRRNRGLMTAGGVTFAVGYLAGIGYAASQGFDNGTAWLAAPVIGPWGAIQARDFKCKSDSNVSQKDINKCVDSALTEVGAITFLAMSGLVQAVGATLFLVGVGTVQHQWVRADLATVEVQATPGPVGSGYGLVLSGHF